MDVDGRMEWGGQDVVDEYVNGDENVLIDAAREVVVGPEEDRNEQENEVRGMRREQRIAVEDEAQQDE